MAPAVREKTLSSILTYSSVSKCQGGNSPIEGIGCLSEGDDALRMSGGEGRRLLDGGFEGKGILSVILMVITFCM